MAETKGGSRSRALREDLERQLLFGDILPGEKLPAQRLLAERYGLSRASVREAITGMELAGLIETRHGGGSVSLNLLQERFEQPVWDEQGSLQLQQQVLELRAMLEGEASFYAVQRASASELAAIDAEFARMRQREAGETTLRKAKADLTFHMLIAESSHHLLLISLSQVLYTRFFNAIYGVLDRTLQKRGRYPARIGQQHASIHAALMRREAEAARDAAREHILYTLSELQAVERP